MKNTVKIFAFAIVAIVMTACSKYEEGSKFTVLSKKSRIVNNWKVKSVLVNGTDQTANFNSGTIEYKKDDTYVTTSSNGSTDNGTWELSGDKLELVTFDSNGGETRAKIIKLKKDEMKLETVYVDFIGNSTIYVVDYETK